MLYFIFQGPTKIQSFTDSILNDNPLSLKLSEKTSTSGKIGFIIWFPIIAISWLLMNWFDVRKPEKRNYFIINYILVHIIIGGLSYLAVWWGTVFGYTVGLPAEITGLIVFAFAFSVPIFYLIVKAAKNNCGELLTPP